MKTLEQYPEYSQRELAEAIGLSLGRTNYVMYALMELGFLKVDNFLKADHKLGKTAYVLTPGGIRQRLELTKGYIERKMAEYEALKAELESLQQEVPEAFQVSTLNVEEKSA